REGVIHAFAIAPIYQETLALLDPALPAISRPTLQQLGIDANNVLRQRRGEVVIFAQDAPLASNSGKVKFSQRNTPALFGAGLTDLIPEQAIIANERAQRVRHGMAPPGSEKLAVGRVHRLPDGKVGRFGWQAQTARLSDFVQAACANELGLGNPNNPQPVSLAAQLNNPGGQDLTQEQCDQLTAYVASLPRPVEKAPTDGGGAHGAAAGKVLFHKIGCAACHTPNLGSVEGIYSDLLLHRMGSDLIGAGNSYGAPPPPVHKDIS